MNISTERLRNDARAVLGLPDFLDITIRPAKRAHMPKKLSGRDAYYRLRLGQDIWVNKKKKEGGAREVSDQPKESESRGLQW